jgi:PAS domain S-box-containing protein
MTAHRFFTRPHAAGHGHIALLGIPMLVLALVTGLAMAAVQIQAALRAYERNTILTASVQAQAITALLRYAHNRTDSEWHTYRLAMRMPESAQQTRHLLVKHGREALPQVEQLLTQAGRDPQDVAAMLRLYRWFGQGYISPTTRQAWRQGDILMQSLEQQAQRLRAAIQRGASPSELDPLLRGLHDVDRAMRSTNQVLSESWARASRSTTLVLQVVIAAIAGVLTLLSTLLIRRTLAEQARYTRSLTEAQRRWELASSAAGLGLYHMDGDTGTIVLDGAAAAMHGLGTQATSVTRPLLRALIVEEDVIRAQGEVDAALQVGEDYRITYRVRHPDGEVRTLEACGRRIASDSGQAGNLVGVLRDVTEVVGQAEQAMKHEASERVAQAQRAFLSRLSHELRTPLNAILGFAQLLTLDNRHPLIDTQRQQVQWILAAGQQLLALIEDVLNLSKVEAGEISLNLERVDVHALVRECLPLMDAAREPNQITIMNRMADTPLFAQVDAQRLRQIVINLLSNACKYGRPNGHATIDTRVEGDEVVIDIGDNGIGMRPEDVAQIFQPFKRLPSAMTHAEGTGLGLYIVKQLVERMQGSVTVMSAPDVGTRFTVRLPHA